jgi:DNA-binding XRE family transcriptional regulator
MNKPSSYYQRRYEELPVEVPLDYLQHAAPGDAKMVVAVPRDTVVVTRLKALRRGAFLTQAELADRAGVTVGTVIRLEQGGPANLATVRRLAEALNVDPTELTRPED